MSFRHPKLYICGSLQRSRSSSMLSGLSQARHSRNCFLRRPLRSSSSTQCLLPSPSSCNRNNSDDETEADDIPTTVHSTLTTTTCVHFEDFSGNDSEYSEYDLVNEQMQDFLLDSDDSASDEEGAGGPLGIGTYCVGGLLSFEPVGLPHTRLRRCTSTVLRRRVAKKSESSASLPNVVRMTPSSSATLLSDLDMNLHDAAAIVGVHTHAHHRRQQQRQRGTLVSGRRRLIPAIVPVCDDTFRHYLHPWSQLRSRLPLFTVIFDLDETLVGARHGGIQLRPHVGSLLRALHVLPIEIIVWTAGTAHYVNPILHAIGQACGRREWFHHIISRHRRWYTGANTSVKDLSLLGRPMDRVLMIENNPISVVQQPSMCILVEDYLEANPEDESLLVLQGVLERLVNAHSSAATVFSQTGGCAVSGSSAQTAHGVNCMEEAVTDPLSVLQRSAPPLSVLLAQDTALQTVQFLMKDVCSKDGISMNRKVELKERVGGAETLVCLALRYSPSLRSALSSPQAQLSVSVRNYGCVNPLLSV